TVTTGTAATTAIGTTTATTTATSTTTDSTAADRGSAAPVLPVAITGTEHVNPHPSRRLRFARVGITVGAPLDLVRFAELTQDRHVVRSATGQLMTELHHASGQASVNK